MIWHGAVVPARSGDPVDDMTQGRAASDAAASDAAAGSRFGSSPRACKNVQVAPQGVACVARAANALLVEVEQVAQAQDVTSGKLEAGLSLRLRARHSRPRGSGRRGVQAPKVHENSIRDE